MRKKNQGHKSRPTPVGLPGVSSAKLPPTVPKVNTKWDGVPQALKDKEKDKDKDRGSYRMSVSAGSSKGGPPSRPSQLSRTATSHSTSSTGSGNRLAEIYGWSTPRSSDGCIAKDFALDHNKPKKTHSTTTLPETTLFATHPQLPPRSVSEQPSAVAMVSDAIPPVPELPFSPAPYPELPQDSAIVPELPADPAPIAELPADPIPQRPKSQGPSLDLTPYMKRPDPIAVTRSRVTLSPPPRNPLRPPPVPELEGDFTSPLKSQSDRHSPLPSPAEWSPVTPLGPPASFPLSNVKASSDTGDDIKQTIIEVSSRDDQVIIISSGVNVLGPPVSALRKPQPERLHSAGRQPFLAGEAEELTLPDESAPIPPSILKKNSSVQKNDSPSRPLLSSYFGTPSPNKESTPGSGSKRDKLGFGFGSKSLSPNTVATGHADTERNVTPTPEGGNSGTLRKKRGLAMFRKTETAESQ